MNDGSDDEGDISDGSNRRSRRRIEPMQSKLTFAPSIVLELQLRVQLKILQIPYGSYTSFTDALRIVEILYGSFTDPLDPSAEAVASAGRQQSNWNVDK